MPLCKSCCDCLEMTAASPHFSVIPRAHWAKLLWFLHKALFDWSHSNTALSTETKVKIQSGAFISCAACFIRKLLWYAKDLWSNVICVCSLISHSCCDFGSGRIIRHDSSWDYCGLDLSLSLPWKGQTMAACAAWRWVGHVATIAAGKEIAGFLLVTFVSEWIHLCHTKLAIQWMYSILFPGCLHAIHHLAIALLFRAHLKFIPSSFLSGSVNYVSTCLKTLPLKF
jgi:hypothetical protein